jgi:DNA-binding NtrC family response regulator
MVDVSAFLVGRCEVFQAFAERLTRVASSDATLLITGESGVGKGRAAEAVHALGARRDGPLVTVSLSALAPTLVEGELFGHEEGAFTGAHRARRGRIRQADGGTLVLDDIDTLPADVQGKLVRVLQTRVVEPLGGEEAHPVDVRVVCTTQRDLEREVASERFRADLYYRIAVVPLDVPPLRARLEDLPELVAHLSLRLADERGVPSRELTPEALALLAEHAWPGNVRELENALERALVLAPPSHAGQTGAASEAAPIDAPAFAFLQTVAAGVATELSDRALAHGLTVDEMECAMLESAMRQHAGNVSAAARQVGLTRRAFEYRLARVRKRSAEEESA